MPNKWILKPVFILFLTIIPSVAYVQPFTDDELSLRKPFPLLVYMHACVLGHGKLTPTDENARKLGFRQAKTSTASVYLKNRTGHAWTMDGPEGFYVVTLLQSGLCSAFIHQGRADELRAGFEAWLPPQDSGFRVVKQQPREAGYLKTTGYDVYDSESLLERWVITTSSDPASEVRAIMSYIKP